MIAVGNSIFNSLHKEMLYTHANNKELPELLEILIKKMSYTNCRQHFTISFISYHYVMC